MQLPPAISNGISERNGEVSQQQGTDEGLRHEYRILEGIGTVAERRGAKVWSPLTV